MMTMLKLLCCMCVVERIESESALAELAHLRGLRPRSLGRRLAAHSVRNTIRRAIHPPSPHYHELAVTHHDHSAHNQLY